MNIFKRLGVLLRYGSMKAYEQHRIISYLHKFCHDRRNNPQQYGDCENEFESSGSAIRTWSVGALRIVDFDFKNFDSYEIHQDGEKVFEVIRGRYGFHVWYYRPTLTIESIMMAMLSDE